jgi:P-aminobenzoate N-oxygenase AurF
MTQAGMAQKGARTKMVRRWRRNMDVQDDAQYTEMLTTLSEGSVRRNFNPYTDIDWKSPEFAVTDNDPRWILPASDPLGRHPWYQAQSRERQIQIGMWRQSNVAKVGLHFESILIRGLMNYSFWVPNGSPEYRYCLHESVEECNHTMMFQEMVNHIGADVPGMPRLLKWISPVIPLVAGPLPIPFFFGVLAGEEPIDHTQKNVLREGKTLHPIMERVMAIHVAEEARHISFAHEYLRKRVPHLSRWLRFWLSLYVPLVMRVLCSAIVVPPKAFWQEFDIPRKVRKELFFGAPESRQMLRDMFADVRMLAHDTNLMNPLAKLMWRICKINGKPSRYRSEPQREHLVVTTAA